MSNLKQFLNSKMRLSHIYQPLMIKTLLENKGIADKSIIAKQFLEYDFSQVEYYEKITNSMPGRILRKHQIVSKDKDSYHLEEFDSLTEDDINELIAICEDKINEYIEKRGKDIWEHRRRNRRPIRGSVRYEVLKRALGRCELCGISKDEKALEVDHIVPKNTGGEDSINNYQALCFTCNSNKRDTDDTDFRGVNTMYEHKDMSCIFCSLNRSVIVENNLAVAFYDKYPVTELHTLIVPKRHSVDYFDLTQAELNAINQLAFQLKDVLKKKDFTIEGFNIGNNSGIVAGQTVFHAHIHLIPRRKGDVSSPIGGVRNVIYGKGEYGDMQHYIEVETGYHCCYKIIEEDQDYSFLSKAKLKINNKVEVVYFEDNNSNNATKSVLVDFSEVQGLLDSEFVIQIFVREMDAGYSISISAAEVWVRSFEKQKAIHIFDALFNYHSL